MDRAEIRQIANVLLECEKAVWKQDSPDAMMLHLNRLYEVTQRLAAAVPVRSDEDQKFALRLMGKKARRLRWQIEQRLGVRN